ncbi:universal stress protein [Roseivivax isoporae]|uniref:Universal stress protein UspA n=1 Tax=Roseivivax isoporae LMG 25204 TaxID=1449351 RepID=X7F8Y8_9RHOB|nr:universal stress protein [Roseivivax isoporae]ETX29377.1 universal stress protein UspA [Roseivivax isoporae LMG 25204]
MFQTILAAYDGSKGALQALDKAAGLARLTGAEVKVLTVYRHHSMLEASLSMVRGISDTRGNLDDVMRGIARETAEDAKAHLKGAGVERAAAYIQGGPSARTIVSFARENACDLIVLGSRGLGSSEGYLLGSVSHKVTSLTDIPVLVV